MHCAVYLYLFALTYNGTWNNLKPVSYCDLDLQLYNNKVGEIVVDVTDRQGHRVDRVLSFFSSRRNWDSPTPSPAGECVPPFGYGGKGTLARGRGGGGVPIPRRGHTLCYSRYLLVCTLWARSSSVYSRGNTVGFFD